MSACATCTHPERERIEAAALPALRRRASWRSVARTAGFTHAQGLRNHMTKHYSDAEADIIAAAVAEAEGLRAEVARLRELAKRQRQLVSDLEGVVAGQRAVIVSLRELRSAA